MTETEFLSATKAEFDSAAGRIDGLLAKATPATWQATNADNGWTTAQIIEHLCRTATIYDQLVESALHQAGASGGASQASPTLFGRMILKTLGKKSVPAPAKLVVTEAVTPEIALENWSGLKDATLKHFENAKGKRLDQPRFRNPFFPVFRMTVVDSLALMVMHLRYHEPQIRRRIEPSA